jgi:TonB-dependent SusC/RagA subfamily outer membrane receptor
MENFMLYLLKSGSWIAAFWGIYRLFLRKETFFNFNRIFLLAGLPASFVLALCQYRYPVFIDLQTAYTLKNTIDPALPETSFRWPLVVSGIYVLGVVALLFRQLTGLNRIYRLIKKRNPAFPAKNRIIDIPEIPSSFSFFGYVFSGDTSRLSETEKRLVLEHETAHAEQKHWIDLIFAQIVCIFQWFNPFAWLYLHSLKQNHEFLADRSVLRKGNSQAVYHAALINYTFQMPIFSLANSFAQYNQFKRITMMKKNSSQSAKKWTTLLLIPALAAFLWAFSKPEYHVSVSPVQPEITLFTNGDTVIIHTDSVAKGNSVRKRILTHIRQSPDTTTTFYFVDGKEVDSIDSIPPHEIDYIEVLKEEAVTLDPKGKIIRVATMKPGKKSKKNWIRKTIDSDSTQVKNTHFIYRKSNDAEPLFFVDGKEVSGISDIDAETIESMSVLKDELAESTYGKRGKNGVIIIVTKEKKGSGQSD